MSTEIANTNVVTTSSPDSNQETITMSTEIANTTVVTTSSPDSNQETITMSTEIANTNAANTTSTLADRQAYVASFANGEDVLATVVDGNQHGLLVHLTDEPPMSALLIGMLPSEQQMVLDAVKNGVKVEINTTVVEANPHSVSKSGNIRARLVVRLSQNEIVKLRAFALANIKPGDTFIGKPGQLLTGDNGPWGLPVQSGRVSGLLHVNATDGRMIALEELAGSNDSVELTVLDVDNARQRVALTNRSTEYVKAIHEMAANVGSTVEGCAVTGVRGDVAFVKIGGLTARVANPGSVTVGDSVNVVVDACDVQRGSWQVSLAS